MKTGDFGRIGVLMGGLSSEREISLESGRAVYEVLKDSGLEVVSLDISVNIEKMLKESQISRAFIALHGKLGEDGTIQRILESLRIPYTGSGRTASFLCFDKVASRRVLKHFGLSVPECDVLHIRTWKKCIEKIDFSFPVVVKPSSEGSSIGVSFVENRKQLDKAVEYAFNYDSTVIVEEYIKGREITVGILDKEPLPVVEIVPEKGFFDFQSKYEKGRTKYLIPARLSGDCYKKAQEAGVLAHNVLGCSAFSRVDMLLKGEEPVILEVNSIPGFTSKSLLPMAANARGISFAQLCLKIIELSFI